MLDYKDTLNLPKTDFPMKGNLSQLEPRLLSWWEEQGIYRQMVARNAQSETFTLHDGPPYANGKLHAGHALNKILKDIIVKYRNMKGQRSDFVPGWDCHGLPIEQAVETRLKKKNIDKRTLSREEFLTKCREYALEFIDVQRDEFKRLGVMAKWDEPYRTLTFQYEAQEIRELATFARREMLYRKKKPVYWCLVDQTALAEAEVEYEEHESPSAYVAFEALSDLGAVSPKLTGEKVAFAIWTTTAWTLPANLAITVHPKFEYVFYRTDDRVLCVAKELLPSFLSQINAGAGVEPECVLATVTGKQLEGLSYQHPFYDRTSKIILGEHVTLDQGTGLVHTAPGHGQEDYEVGLAYGLEVYNPVKNDGRFDDTVGPLLAGKKVFEANPIVIELLAERGALLNAKGATVKHSYPHCWRCHNPIIYRATHQWFIPLDKDGFRQKALAEIERVRWVPKWGRERIHNMLENRPDWCISRQRQWGVPIPMALCEHCDAAVISPELMEKVAAVVEKEGAGAWYRTPVEEFLPAGFTCPDCGKASFRRETDILDVWFDSACSFSAVVEKQMNQSIPVDLYLEGSDQHRGWFHSSLLVAVGTRDRAPYKTCLTHGFVVDGNGRKMSKSVGNVVAPEKIITQYGAEILRLWVASSDYRDDIRLSDQILKGLSESYRKIRNTLRYALSNLYDFDPATDSIARESLSDLDVWALLRLGDLLTKVTAAYEAYEFHIVFHAVVDFCAMDLSALYFDILKDRLYTFKPKGEARRGAQTVLYEIAKSLLQILAPIMSFTSEEAWQMLPGEKAVSIFLTDLPGAPPSSTHSRWNGIAEKYHRLFTVRGEVQKHLEIARRDKKIGASLEAKVRVGSSGETYALLQKHLRELPSLFIVSQVELDLLDGGEMTVEVMAAEGNKCPRCWTYSTVVGQRSDICAKCQEVVG